MIDLKPEALPIWMQKSMRRTDWGVLIVLAFSLLAAWSFVLQPGLPRTNDSEHYVYQAANTARAFSEGRFFPRWSPDALNGYGAPIPQFYAPGASYAAALLSFFVTGDPTQAVKLVYIGAFLGAGAGVYAFMTRRSGAAAGVIAALLYVYSPYFGLTAPHLLGDLPGMVGLALIPALLWSIDRLIRTDHALDFAYVALFTAALLLTDPTAAVAGWGLALAVLLYTQPTPTTLSRALSAGTIGLGAAACFWLPALVEASTVQWFARPLLNPHVLSFPALLTPLIRLDPAALIHPPQFTLGLTLPVFAVAAVFLVRRSASFHRLFLAIGILLTVLALTVMRAEVWLVGIISLCLSISGSALVFWSKSRVFVPILSGLILGIAAPIWLVPQGLDMPIDASPAAQFQYEQQGFGIATLPNGKTLPSLVAPDTPTSRSLITSYSVGEINKIEQTADAQTGILEHGTHQDRFQVQTFAPLTLTILTADFPGWSAHFNNSPLPVTHDEQGLIHINLPGDVAGELTISLGTTPTRTLAWTITWAALLLLLGITIRRSRRPVVDDRYQPLDLLKNGEARLLVVLVIGFSGVLALVALPAAPLSTPFSAADALTMGAEIEQRSDSGLELLTYQLDRTSLAPGETLNLALYWQATETPAVNYQARVSLLDLSTGAYPLRSALRDPGGFPTLRWSPRRYVEDRYALTLPADLPAGRYSPTVEVCTLECFPSSRLNFFGYDGDTYGSVLVLPVIVTIE